MRALRRNQLLQTLADDFIREHAGFLEQLAQQNDVCRLGQVCIGFHLGCRHIEALNIRRFAMAERRAAANAKKAIKAGDFEAASEVAGYITPVPGGVGQMTITMLLSNTLRAAQALSEA